jgi:hypothetical protein
VEFFEGVNKIGEALNAPYIVTWLNVPENSYTLRAVATDNTGLMSTSAPVVLNVVTSLPLVLLRGPYLLAGSSTGGVVRWRTDQFSDGVVFYGTDANSLTNVATETTLTNDHLVTIRGLEPDTKYFYSIGSSGHGLAGGTNVGGTNFWFSTSPVAGTPKPTRFWILGDSGTANANARAVRDAYYNFASASGRPADFWLMLGDNAYNSGTDSEHQTAVFEMYPATLRNLFLWPVLGNHESAFSYEATQFPYLDIFSTPQNGEAGGLPSGSGKYYSFDYANIHFVGLDSMTSARSGSSPMAQWLRSDLASSTQTWTVVYFHHPPYTKGSHNSDAETDLVEMRQNIVPILEAAGVDLVLSGHSHCYERSFLLNGHYGSSATLLPTMKINAGDGKESGAGVYQKNTAGEGVVYSVAGSSGQISGGPLDHPAHFISLNELGSLIVDVNSNRLDVMFLNSSGVQRDQFTLLKRVPVMPNAPSNVVARAHGTNEIEISWADAADDEWGFYLERSLDGIFFVRFATNNFNATNFLDGNLSAETIYYYRVIAFNGAGESTSAIASDFTGNHAPTLLLISNIVADVARGFFFKAQATDADVPANLLAYSLDAGAPAGARVNPTNGFFRWVPARGDANTTNVITLRVTDNGSPALSAARTFSVTVRDYIEMMIGSSLVEAGQGTNVWIDVVTTAPLTNLTFAVARKTALINISVENLIPAAASAVFEVANPDQVALTFAALPGQMLAGTQRLARLHFSTPGGQPSAFVSLHIPYLFGERATAGLAPSSILNDGRVVLIGNQPLLEARSGPGGLRVVSLYGHPGKSYSVEISTVPENSGSWQPWRSVELSDFLHSIDATEGTNFPSNFYRARELP